MCTPKLLSAIFRDFYNSHIRLLQQLFALQLLKDGWSPFPLDGFLVQGSANYHKLWRL